jgi:hypothetical protein
MSKPRQRLCYYCGDNPRKAMGAKGVARFRYCEPCLTEHTLEQLRRLMSVRREQNRTRVSL